MNCLLHPNCELHLSASYRHLGNVSMRSVAMEPIAYPSLTCPFPSAINPHATEAQHATITWARRFRLLQRDAAYRRLNRLQYGMLMARAYPSAATETLQ